MDAILNFTEFVIQSLLTLIIWIVIAYAILSWLISFEIVNLRNRFVYRASRFLDGIATPLLRPFRRFLPNLGGLDFSPILLFIIIGGLQRYLIPPLFAWLHGLVGGGGGGGA
ncbi:MAG TPA: YggT family protein [Caulobacteraceae bacterium]